MLQALILIDFAYDLSEGILARAQAYDEKLDAEGYEANCLGNCWCVALVLTVESQLKPHPSWCVSDPLAGRCCMYSSPSACCWLPSLALCSCTLSHLHAPSTHSSFPKPSFLALPTRQLQVRVCRVGVGEWVSRRLHVSHAHLHPPSRVQLPPRLARACCHPRSCSRTLPSFVGVPFEATPTSSATMPLQTQVWTVL